MCFSKYSCYTFEPLKFAVLYGCYITLCESICPHSLTAATIAILKNRLIVSCRLPEFMVSPHWPRFIGARRMHADFFFPPYMEKYDETITGCKSKMKAASDRQTLCIMLGSVVSL